MYNNREDIKPKNLKLHDFLVRKTAVQVMIDETIVEKIISHEKKSINNAFKVHNQVEISGFGKLVISQIKLKKKISKSERILSALQGRLQNDLLNPDTLTKIELINNELAYFRARLKEENT